MLSGPVMPGVRWHGRGDVRVDDVEVPADPAPGMAVVAVAYCGICGTDVAEFVHGPFLIRTSPHPLTGQSPPITLGHELSGRVVAVGEDVAVAPGTRVTADACWRCGRCPACVRGEYQRCRYSGSIGLSSDGAFAPLLVVPAYTLVPLPDSVDDRAAALTEPLAVGLHALDRAGARAGDDVVVLGFGAIGGAGALVARSLGASVLVVDASSARLAVATRLGLATLEAGEDLPRRLRGRLGRLGADVVLDCTGLPAVAAQAIRCADRGGRIVAVGLARATARIDCSELTLYERSLIGSLGYRHDLPRVVALMASGALDPTPLIGGEIERGEVPETLERMASRPDERIKILVAG